jgi:hypothetical protein
MGFSDAVLRVKLLLDASQAAAGLDKAAGKTQGLGKAFGAAAGALAGAAITKKVIDFGKASVTAAQESAVATARLDAVFKSMGDTTGQASKQAQQYASTLSRRIGVDDEVIMKGQAMLATFGAVSSATARQAGIFDRATAAGADLAAAGFGSIESNAVQLGKALQDPTKGLTALAKSGVTFTKSQKDQIAAMQKSGDLLGAQKVVLAAVEGQVKGTAEATATSADKQKVAYGEMQEAIGAKLLPIMEKLQGTMSKLFDFIGANAGWLMPVIAGIVALGVALQAFTMISHVVTAANLLMAQSWWAAFWPVALVVVGIIALIAILVLLYNKCAWFRAAVQAVWAAITAVFTAAVSGIGTVLNSMGQAFSAAFRWIANVVSSYARIIFLPFSIAFDIFKALVSGNWSQVIAIFAGIPGRIVGALGGLAHAIGGPFAAAFDFVKRIVEDAVAWIVDKLSSVGRAVSGAVDTVRGLWNSFARTWNAIEVSVPGVSKGPIKIGGFTFGLPDLPLLASGAYVRSATLAVVGEGRGGEWVIPDRMLRKAIRDEGGGATINVYVPPTANPAETGRAVANVLRSYFAAGGRLVVPSS